MDGQYKRRYVSKEVDCTTSSGSGVRQKQMETSSSSLIVIEMMEESRRRRQGSHSFTDKKSRTSTGPPWKIFRDLFGARKSLNIKKKWHLLTIFRLQSTAENSAWSKMWTLCANWVLYYCCYFAFKPLEKCMTFKDIFLELSRTFQDQSDFLGLSRSWNFQEKNFQDFPVGVGTLRRRYRAMTYKAEAEPAVLCRPLGRVYTPLLDADEDSWNWGCYADGFCHQQTAWTLQPLPVCKCRPTSLLSIRSAGACN